MTSLNRRSFCASLCAACTSPLLHPVYAALPPSGTGYVHHPDFSSFENNIIESYQRTRWIDTRLEASGAARDTKPVPPFAEPMEYIRQLHTGGHIALIDEELPFGDFTLSIGQVARTAVGHILGAVDEVCGGRLRNAFCSIRPPGHHVQNSGEIGFCCFANVVLAALFARRNHGIGKILIVDWDFHQGNGTHGHLCGDNETLFFETFNPDMYTTKCDDFKPVDKGGQVPDDALRINVRMPAGSTNDEFVRVYEETLIPVAERFRPELVLVSCGFDCKLRDRLGTFQITANGISRLTRIIMRIADAYSGGKLVSVLEGGYSDSPRDSAVKGTGHTFSGLAQCAENHVKTLLTGEEQPETPFFSSASTVSMYRPARRSAIRWQNGKLTDLPVIRQPLKLVISDVNGQRIAVIRNISRSWVEPDRRKLADGTYTLTLYGRTGKMLYTKTIMHTATHY